MKSIAFDVTCPRCGGDLNHEAAGVANEVRVSAIVRCTGCGLAYVVEVKLAAAPELGRPRGRHPDTCRCARCTNARKTTCSKGHPFSPENTYIRPGNGQRVCKACRNETKKKAA